MRKPSLKPPAKPTPAKISKPQRVAKSPASRAGKAAPPVKPSPLKPSPAKAATPKKTAKATAKAAGRRRKPPAVAPPSGPVKRVRTKVALDEQFAVEKKPRRAAKRVEQAKRRKPVDKNKRQELMAPSDDLMARLARIGVLAGSAAGEEDNSISKRRANGAATRRPRRWELRCGKCGTVGTFKNAAGICPRCGAITLRE